MLSLAACLVLAYSARAFMYGKLSYDRVAKQGSSIFMPKGPMEIAYWGIEKLGKLLIFFKIKPNQISMCCLILAATSGVALAFGYFGVAGFLITFSSLMDGLDGYVARATNTTSLAGKVLDSAIDRYAEFFFIAGLCFFYRDITWMLVVVLFALLGSFMVSYSTAKAEAMYADVPRGNMRRSERALYMAIGAIFSPLSLYYLEAGYMRPIAYPMAFSMILVAVFANYSAVLRLRSLINQLQKYK